MIMPMRIPIIYNSEARPLWTSYLEKTCFPQHTVILLSDTDVITYPEEHVNPFDVDAADVTGSVVLMTSELYIRLIDDPTLELQLSVVNLKRPNVVLCIGVTLDEMNNVSDQLPGFVDRWTVIDYSAIEDAKLVVSTELQRILLSAPDQQDEFENIPEMRKIPEANIGITLVPSSIDCGKECEVVLVVHTNVNPNSELIAYVCPCEDSGGTEDQMDPYDNGRLELEQVTPNTYKFKIEALYAKDVWIQVFNYIDETVYKARLTFRVDYSVTLNAMERVQTLISFIDVTCKFAMQPAVKPGRSRVEVNRQLSDDVRSTLDATLQAHIVSRIDSNSLNNMMALFESALEARDRYQTELPTVLHLVAKYGLTDMCSALTDFRGFCSANYIRNINGLYPKDVARKHGHTDLSELLEDYVTMTAQQEDVTMEIYGMMTTDLYNYAAPYKVPFRIPIPTYIDGPSDAPIVPSRPPASLSHSMTGTTSRSPPIMPPSTKKKKVPTATLR